MTKETIIKRLLDQGHITIPSADVILNKKPDYVEIIESLHTDGPVNTEEAVILLSDPYYEAAKFPLGTYPPNIQTFPDYPAPHGPSQPTWTWPDIYCAPNETTGTPPNDLGNTTCNTIKYPKGTSVINTDQPGPTGNNGSVGTDGTNKIPQDTTSSMDNINSI